jgi:hypothetical protein
MLVVKDPNCMRKKSQACGIWFLYGTDLKIDKWNWKSMDKY